MSEDQVEKELEALVKVDERERQLGTPRPPGVSAPVEAGGINHLALNCVVPGLGSLVRGKTQLGAAQLGLALVALVLLLTGHWLLGPLVGFGAWVWSVVTGIGFVREKKLSW